MSFLKLLSHSRKTFLTVSLLLSGYFMYAQPSYCSSGLGGTTGDVDIVNVTIPGTALNNSYSGVFPYYVFPISGSSTATLQQGGTYTISVRDSLGTGSIAMWVDFNQDGVFETYEWVSIATSVAGTASVTFTVPLTAHTGVTGLRVRSRDVGEGYVSAGDACTNYYTGQTQDYYITIDTTLPCSGTPAVASVTGPPSSCPGNAFTLILSGYTVSSGLTYQWLSHPVSGGAYTAIAGATNSSYTGSISAATDYELKITCTSSGLSSTSATFTESLTPVYMCYCNDSLTLGGNNLYAPIDTVSITGTLLHNYTPGNPHIYSAYPATGSTTATLYQGQTYSMVVNSSGLYSYYYPANISMWIDYNHNGTYDPVEYTLVGTGIAGNAVVSFTVPVTATTGLTGLRVRTIAPSAFGESMGSGDPCTDYMTGETEDYIITIDTTYPCSGTPVAGTITAPDSVCASQLFTLAATGYTVATGIGFQWYSRPAGTGTFTVLPGATSTSCMIYAQAIATDYKLIATCTTSSLTASTTYTVYEYSFFKCYCDSASLGGSSGYSPIDSVSIAGTTLNNYTPFNPNTYTAYPATGSTTATLQQGGYYTVFTSSNDGFDPATTSMWIDYNHSGTYDPVEWTLVGTDILGKTSAAFYVPLTALTGHTGLRIRTIAPNAFGEYMGSGDACTTYETGETEDYIITIDTTYPCTGTPVSGSITGPDSICNSIPFNLALTGYTNNGGITFQWQSRPAGSGSFTAIAGATLPFYSSPGISAAADYNVVVTCTNTGASVTSATFTEGLISFFNCYCSPANGTTLVSYGGQDQMMDAQISGTGFNATAMSVPINGYEQIPPTYSSNTAIMHTGYTYNYTVTTDSNMYFVQSVGVWIDYNHNGTYDATEFTGLVSVPTGGSNGTFTGSVTIPVGSLVGQTGMRIASSEEIIISNSSACGDFYYGEAIDFTVTLDSDSYVSPLAGTDFTVQAFPNPVNKMVTVRTFGTPGNNRNIILTDITGRVIEKVSMDTNQKELDMENLEPGIYLVKYEDDEHSSVIKINKVQ